MMAAASTSKNASDWMIPMASTARRASPALRTPVAVTTRTRGVPTPGRDQRDDATCARTSAACAAEKITTSDTDAAPRCCESQLRVQSSAGTPARSKSGIQAPPATPQIGPRQAASLSPTSARISAWKPTSSARSAPPPSPAGVAPPWLFFCAFALGGI